MSTNCLVGILFVLNSQYLIYAMTLTFLTGFFFKPGFHDLRRNLAVREIKFGACWLFGEFRPKYCIEKNLFIDCFRHGGEVVNQEAGSSKPNTLKFSGTGYRLGETSNDTQGIVRAYFSTDSRFSIPKTGWILPVCSGRADIVLDFVQLKPEASWAINDSTAQIMQGP